MALTGVALHRERRGCDVVPVRPIVATALGYALGSVPSADLASRAAGGPDLRTAGTHNPGGLNAAHVLGRGWGGAVVALDVAKGFVAARIGRRIAGDRGAELAATAAVVGHCFPPGHGGGKGVATSVGQVLGTFPSYLPVDVAVGVATAAAPWFRQRTRVATAVASAAWVGCATLWWRRGLPNPGGVHPTVMLPLTAAISSAVIAARFAREVGNVDAYNRPRLVEEVAA